MCQKPVINDVLEVNLYQKIPIGTQPVYTTGHLCMGPAYTAKSVCTQPVYTAVCIHP
jgi:hypothetical protein